MTSASLGTGNVLIDVLIFNADECVYVFNFECGPASIPSGAGYEDNLAKFTLKKFLLLILMLDKTKVGRLLQHDPCLFCRDSEIKVRSCISNPVTPDISAEIEFC